MEFLKLGPNESKTIETGSFDNERISFHDQHFNRFDKNWLNIQLFKNGEEKPFYNKLIPFAHFQSPMFYNRLNIDAKMLLVAEKIILTNESGYEILLHHHDLCK